MDPPPYLRARDDLSPTFESKSDLVIAIDFGTTFSGVAYAHESNAAYAVTSMSDMKRVAEKVTVVRSWPNQVGTFNDKTPTVLAYNSSPPHWGASVQPNDKPRAAHFKLGLQENVSNHYVSPASSFATISVLGGYLMDHNWMHPDLPQKKAVDFTADYLTRLIDHVLTEVLPLHFGADFLKNQQLSYVITVPAIWSDKAKELTRQAAIRAGIARRKLMLITEPEAAALFCATLCTDMDLREGDRFLVCDAGGGTVVCSQ
jgi:molecular chaperone DnaK (HSP70)